MCLVIRNFGGCRMKLCSLKRRSPKCVSAVFDGAEVNRRCDWRRRVVFAEMKVAEMCAPNSTDTSHVRGTSLFTGAIPNPVRNSQTSRFVSVPGQSPERSSRGDSVVLQLE